MDVLFLGKPPKTPEEFVEIFNLKYPTMLPWKRLKNIYQIPQFLSNKPDLVLLCDEIHEAPLHVLEWLRVLSDQCDNLTLVFSGLPVFETKLMQKLETLRKRVACKIELFSLSKEDTIELVKKRIESAGGRGTEPFSKEALESVFEQSAGFPREVLRISDNMINRAATLNTEIITPDVIEKQPEQAKIDLSIFSDKQKQILELLIHPMPPSDIINTIGLENYKSATHALRSVNNILKRMMELNYVERAKKNRTYLYSLSPKLKTLFVIA